MSQSGGPGLEKTLGLFALVAYGVGDTLGAGIYALLGKVADIVGCAYWLSFLAALVAAGLTALTYAELVSRYPHAAGEAHYSFMAFSNARFSYILGFLVLMSGVVSMATVSHGFAGYLEVFRPGIPRPAVIFIFFSVLAAITLIGMRESSAVNIFCTIVEVSGILVIIAAGLPFLAKTDFTAFQPGLETAGQKAGAVLGGAVFAFYAFIGFEDMVKTSEETHDPQKTLPRAMLISFAVIGVLYLLTAFSAVAVLGPGPLAQSNAPLMSVVEKGMPGFPRWLFTMIALFAVSNTALANFIMSTRLLYGMARDGLMPRALESIHPRFRTPDAATFLVFLIVLALALTGTITRLAEATAFLLLFSFFSMNTTLIVLKLKKDTSSPPPGFQISMLVPVLGALACLSLGAYVSNAAILKVALLAAAAVILYEFTAPLRCRTGRERVS